MPVWRGIRSLALGFVSRSLFSIHKAILESCLYCKVGDGNDLMQLYLHAALINISELFSAIASTGQPPSLKKGYISPEIKLPIRNKGG